MEVDDRVRLEDKTRKKSQDDPHKEQRRAPALPAMKAKGTFTVMTTNGSLVAAC